MIGAVIGDIVGSRFEYDNCKNKNFELFAKECFPTDDTIMTVAVGKAILESEGEYQNLGARAIRCMQELGRPYPRCGYGSRFYDWIYSEKPEPYESYGNGAAMRICAVGFAARNAQEVKQMSKTVTEISHNHPEGLRGAEAVAMAILLARQCKSKEEIRSEILKNYYSIDFRLAQIRDSYEYHVDCQGSVPQALEAFFESVGFEDAIRNAISIGGDSDTIAAITGSVAEAYYGIPVPLREKAEKYLNNSKYAPIFFWLKKFEKMFP